MSEPKGELLSLYQKATRPSDLHGSSVYDGGRQQLACPGRKALLIPPPPFLGSMTQVQVHIYLYFFSYTYLRLNPAAGL